MEYIFCLPGTSAIAERTFSMMNTIWSEERSTMKKSTVEGLLICKLNIGLSCSEFYSKIKNNFWRKFIQVKNTSGKTQKPVISEGIPAYNGTKCIFCVKVRFVS